ncbi:alpha/beta hydrolase [Tessaracoccus terricola]
MTTDSEYASFLPSRLAARVVDPEQTWWQWRGHRVHVARRRRPDAPVRLLLVHGAGGHVGALWPLVSLLTADVDVAAVDLPLYGRTDTPDPASVRYEDWLELLADLVTEEDDDRPLVLLGASIGGMLAYETACRTGAVAAVAATCLLDPRDWRVRAHLTRFGRLGLLAGPLTRLVRGPLARVMIPLRWTANLSAMSRDPELSALCARDPLGGGARVPLGFLASYLRHRHLAPRTATVPVLLLHPGRDDWTPPELSVRVLARAASPSRIVLLRECGHFPVEEPGIDDLLGELDGLLGTVAEDGAGQGGAVSSVSGAE